MGVGFVLLVCNLIFSLWAGRRAPMNPWGAATLEWACASPPPHDNFIGQPDVDSAYDYAGVHYDPILGGYISDVGLQQKVARDHE